MKVEFTPTAAAQLNEISVYIREQDPSAAVRVAVAIEAAANSLATMPYVGRKQDLEGVRKKVVTSTPYLIFYTVLESDNIVRVLAIAHARRQRRYGDS